MPKSIKNCFDSKLNFVSLLEAHDRASKAKRSRREVLTFEIDLETNIMNLYNRIKKGTYKVGKYNEFIVKEPKVRIIRSLPYIDRIVHQWYIEEFIKPMIGKKFIADSYACIENGGTHKAVRKIQHYMRIMKHNTNKYYILKCDIQKYFYNIDRNILISILKRHISDCKLLDFTKMLIFDNEETVGIPIGNYTSQFFANIYLNELDHYVKENLRIKYYVRYMDDFILLLPSKEEAMVTKKKIVNFIEDKLKLKLNKKSNYFPNSMGVDFCGYRIFETHILLRKRSKKKIGKLVRDTNRKVQEGNCDISKVKMSWNSWKAHASHSNSYRLKKKYHDLFLIKDYLDI